jgi:signal transduction histidine kinase
VLRASNPPAFSAGTRWAATAGALVGGALAVWWVGPSAAGPDRTDRYVLAHALTAMPFLLVSAGAAWRLIGIGPAEYRPFWRRWTVASGLGTAASIAATLSVTPGHDELLMLDMALLVAGVPVWISATLLMLRYQAGRRSVSVDLVDALSALAVLGTPGVLLVAAPLAETDKLGFALPFAVAAVSAPVTVYLAVLNLARIPRGERVAHGIGVALGAATGVNLTMQLARVLGGLTLPLRAFVVVHVANMGLLLLTPLWAHRRACGGLAVLPDHRQVRRANPMPYLGAVGLPLLGVFVFLTRDDRPWGVWFFVAVVLAVVVLNAVRYTAMIRETRRLYAGIARLSEERRRLLTRMLRGLEDDRHRTATELHSQAVGSLATLGTLVQLARVALPGEAALTVTETVTRLQDDLSARAEHLRQLMLAMRPPEFPAESVAGDEPPRNDTLTAALLAYAAELGPEGTGPTVHVAVQPSLRLDWSTMTVVYRVAQEAVLNAIQHARASAITVEVADDEGRVAVEIADDGSGFEAAAVPRGSGLAAMELFTQLGGGELAVRSAPGEGTAVRCLLGGGRAAGLGPGPGPGPGSGRGPNGDAVDEAAGGTARHLRSVH